MQAEGDGPGWDTLLVQLMKRVSPRVKASVWCWVQTPSGSASAVYLRGGGEGRGAALRSGHRRRGALRSSRAARRARVRSRSHAAAAGRRRGGGGACSTCPSSPSPRPKLKNNKKQLITPKRSAERLAEGAA